MKNKRIKILYYLAGYVILMGILGYLRTSAMMPIYINGSLALVTSVLAFFYYQNKKKLHLIVSVWVFLNFLMYTYMTIFRVSAHPNPTVGTYLIFGSMAIFSLITFFYIKSEKID